MPDPVTADIPHKLGREVVRERLDGGVAKIADMVPGGTITDHHWEDDVMHFTVAAMGQTVVSRLELFDEHVHVVVDLPPMLALFADRIREKLRDNGQKLLR